MKSFAVIGCGRFGSSLAKTLTNMGHEVLAIDKHEESIEDISPYVTTAVVADAADEDALKTLGLSNIDVVVVSIGSDLNSSIIATITAKEMGVKKVLCKARDELHSKILYKIGADKVVFPERDMGIKTARFLASDNLQDVLEIDTNHTILEIAVPETFVGKSLAQLDVRAKYSVNVIGVKTEDTFDISPDPTKPLSKDSVLVIIGKNVDLNRIEKIK